MENNKKYGLGQKSLANLKIPQPKIARPKKARQQCLIFVDMFRIRRCFVTAKKYKLHATTKDHNGQKLNSNTLDDMFEIFFLQNNMLIFLSL